TMQVSIEKRKNKNENSNPVSISQEKLTKKLSCHICYNKKCRLEKEQNSILLVEHNEPISTIPIIALAINNITFDPN
ncbi:27677_t:CDS:1, partial [Racocetra persica]